MIRKSLQGVSHIFRVLFILVVILIQLLFVFELSKYASDYLALYYTAEYILVFIFILFINYQTARMSFKLSWIVFIALFPAEGIIIYSIYYLLLRINWFTKKHNAIQEATATIEAQDDEIVSSITSKSTKQLVELIYRQSRYPVSKNTELKYLPLGEEYQSDLIEELKKAENYIFMQYFIITKGQMLDDIMEILIDKASKGVEVYFSYDTFGSITTKPKNFDDYCRSNNIHVLPFGKDIKSLYAFFSYRDHRKITVVDGSVAFTGGINIGDEYINKHVRFGHWKDMGVKLYGDGAKNLSMIFMKGWNMTNPNTFDYDKYLNLARPHNIKSENLVVCYDDGPFSDEDVAERTYVRMIATARKYVYITTPYLIPSTSILSALKLAAISGVDVKILTPGIPDKKLVFECTRSHYAELLEAGVQILEYTPGFVHGKTMVSDDRFTFVGSVNLDFRSLIWNYECGAWTNDPEFAKTVCADTLKAFEQSHNVTIDEIRSTPLHIKALRSGINLLAPLL